MGHTALGVEFGAQCVLGGDGNAVLGGLSVDKEFGTNGFFVGDLCAQAVAFFTDEKEKPYMNALLTKTFGGGNLYGDDAFCVARAASVYTVGVLARWDEWRHGIHVRGEDNLRPGLLWGRGEDVAAIGRGWDLLCLVAHARKFGVE